MNNEEQFSHKKSVQLGIVIIILIFGMFGVWATFVKIDLSIMAPGKLIVQSYKKNVEHPKGGFVKELYVQEGDSVKKGEPLLKLDTNQLQAKLQEANQVYRQLQAQKIRVEAELNHKTPNFPQEIPYEIREKERTIYENRLKNLKEQLTNIDLKIKEEEKNIKSLQVKLNLDRKLLTSYQKEYRKWQELFKENMVDELKVMEIRRKIDQIEGEIASLKAQIEAKRATIETLKNQKKLIKSRYIQELQDLMQKIDDQLPRVRSQRKIYEDEINKSIITAPASGKVIGLHVHTPGELIAPHKTILSIVPQSDRIVIEAKVSPMDIDKVHVGQQAEINFASYVDPSAKPVYGKVIYVSADVLHDPNDPRIEYYKVLVEITPEGMQAIKENGFEIKPGMPVTVFIHAGKRTFLSYILLPLEQLIKGAFRAN